MCLVPQLKLRERLLPEIVNQADYLEGHASSNGGRPQVIGNGKKGKGGKGSKAGPPLKTWAANPKLFPRDVSAEAQKLMEEVRCLWGLAPSPCQLACACFCDCQKPLRYLRRSCCQ